MGIDMKKKRKIEKAIKLTPIWIRQDWDLIDSPTKKIFLAYPQHLDDILRTLEDSPLVKCPLDMINIFLDEFKREAQALLKRIGFNDDHLKDPKSLMYIQKVAAKNRNIMADNASRVLLGVNFVREAIKKKDAGNTAIEMMRLVFAALTANLYDLVLRGIRAKTAPVRGGRVPKKLEGIILAIKKVLKKAKRKGALDLWHYFKNNHKKNNDLQIGEYAIWFYEDPTGAGENLLYLSDGEKERGISFSAFKRYVREVKKTMEGE
jgi:hypothetical protein